MCHAGNGIGDSGATALSEALKMNWVLHTLDLSGMLQCCVHACLVLQRNTAFPEAGVFGVMHITLSTLSML